MLLCRAVEEKSGIKGRTSKDFERLAEMITDSNAGFVSSSTLKRFWGYVKDTRGKHTATLDVLSRFAGYPKGFGEFEMKVNADSHAESGYDRKRVLEVMKLERGTRVTVEWLPDRLISLTCLGNCLLEVTESVNAKLSEGAVVRCLRIVEGEKLIVDVVGDGKPMVYEAGKVNGVVWRLA